MSGWESGGAVNLHDAYAIERRVHRHEVETETDRTADCERVAEAMKAKRLELISRPLANIWLELGKAAIVAMSELPGREPQGCPTPGACSCPAPEAPASAVRVKRTEETISADRIAAAMDDGRGFWRGCSGCHELNDGAPTGRFSKALKCHVGLGCFECGGIGAIWDTTDYGAMGDALAADLTPPARTYEDGVKDGVEKALSFLEQCGSDLSQRLAFAVRSLMEGK